MDKVSDPARFNFQTLQCGRALAALAVVLFHANGTLALPKYFGIQPAHVFSSGFSGIYYFFVLSGAVMVLAHWRQIGQRQSPRNFFIKRFVRIYLPLWAVLAIIVPLLAGRAGLGDILLAFSALPAGQENILAIEWTLRHEILFYALFGVLLWRPRLGMALLGLWLAASGLTALWNIPFPIDFLLSNLHLLFGAGMLGAVAIVKGWGPPRPIAAAGAILFALAWLSQVLSIQSLETMSVWLYGAGALLLIVGFAQMEVHQGLTTPKFLQQMGDASYSLYLVHFPVISLCAKLFFWLNGRAGGLPLIFYFVMTVGIAVACGFAFHKCIEAPLLRLGKQTFARRASHPVKAMD